MCWWPKKELNCGIFLIDLCVGCALNRSTIDFLTVAEPWKLPFDWCVLRSEIRQMHAKSARCSYEQNSLATLPSIELSVKTDGASQRLEAFIFPRKVIRRVLSNTERAFLTANSSRSSRNSETGKEEEKTEQQDLRCQRPGKNLTRRSNCKLHKVQEVSNDAIAEPGGGTS